jgi:hypothetical protein
MSKIQTRLQAFDIAGQIAMIVIPLAFSVVDALALVAIMLGSWQLLSFFVHFFAGKPSGMLKARRFYGIAVLVLFISGLLSLAGGGLFIVYLCILAVAGPVLGIWYMCVSVQEWRNLRRQMVLTSERAS